MRVRKDVNRANMRVREAIQSLQLDSKEIGMDEGLKVLAVQNQRPVRVLRSEDSLQAVSLDPSA